MKNNIILIIYVKLLTINFCFSTEVDLVYINTLGTEKAVVKSEIEQLDVAIKESIQTEEINSYVISNQDRGYFISLLENFGLEVQNRVGDESYDSLEAYEKFSELYFNPGDYGLEDVYYEAFNLSNKTLNLSFTYSEEKINFLRDQLIKRLKNNRVILLTHQQSTKFANELLQRTYSKIELSYAGLNDVFHKRIGNLMLSPLSNEIEAFSDDHKTYIKHDRYSNESTLQDNVKMDKNVTLGEESFYYYLEDTSLLDKESYSGNYPDGYLLKYRLTENIREISSILASDNGCINTDSTKSPQIYISPNNVVSNKFASFHVETTDLELLKDYTVLGIDYRSANKEDNLFDISANSNFEFNKPITFNSQDFYNFISERDLNNQQSAYEYHLVKKSDIYLFLQNKETECPTYEFKRDSLIGTASFSNALDQINMYILGGTPLAFQFTNKMPYKVSNVTFNNINVPQNPNLESTYESVYDGVLDYQSETIDINVEFESGFSYRYYIDLKSPLPLDISFNKTIRPSTANNQWGLIDINVTRSGLENCILDLNGFWLCSEGSFLFDYAIHESGIIGTETESMISPESISRNSTYTDCNKNIIIIPKINFIGNDGFFGTYSGNYIFNSGLIFEYDRKVIIRPPESCNK